MFIKNRCSFHLDFFPYLPELGSCRSEHSVTMRDRNIIQFLNITKLFQGIFNINTAFQNISLKALFVPRKNFKMRMLICVAPSQYIAFIYNFQFLIHYHAEKSFPSPFFTSLKKWCFSYWIKTQVKLFQEQRSASQIMAVIIQLQSKL